jgi:hypothetical protein
MHQLGLAIFHCPESDGEDAIDDVLQIAAKKGKSLSPKESFRCPLPESRLSGERTFATVP